VTDFHAKALFRLLTGDGSHTNGVADEEQFAQAGSSAYECWLRLANETANQLYRNSLVGGLAGSMFETSLHLRSMGDAISFAILGYLWPALELPTAGQLLRLSQDVAALRRQCKRWVSEEDEGVRLTPNGNGTNRARDDRPEPGATPSGVPFPS
jgi:hypothetical protein